MRKMAVTLPFANTNPYLISVFSIFGDVPGVQALLLSQCRHNIIQHSSDQCTCWFGTERSAFNETRLALDNAYLRRP